MKSTLKAGRVVWAAALLTISGAALAQDNAANNVAGADTSVANNTLADPTLADPALGDPTLNDPMATDLGTANGMETMPLPMDDTMANDLALANTAAPEREDNDFPWGLLGLLGLAGLLGRKKNNDVHVDNRTDRRDV